jgi:hypothetical protein
VLESALRRALRSAEDDGAVTVGWDEAEALDEDEEGLLLALDDDFFDMLVFALGASVAVVVVVVDCEWAWRLKEKAEGWVIIDDTLGLRLGFAFAVVRVARFSCFVDEEDLGISARR